MQQAQVLIVDDEQMVLDALAQTLELEDYCVSTASNGQQALEKITPDWPGVIISDINMPVMDGLSLMRKTQQLDRGIPVILLTGHGDVSLAVEAMREGAYDFLEKPFATEQLLDTLARAQEKRHLTLENRDLRQAIAASSRPGPRIIGNSPAIIELRQTLDQVKDTPADILINADTGCGKDLAARYLHQHSARGDKPFVAINCGALPESMIESELFGHESGAFTGANKKRVGKFEAANGGTLFLDEIESMPLSLQTRLLRVLEERCVEPLGSNRQIPLDIRIVAASKGDLFAKAQSGEFRSDLYYRLNVVQVQIPNLQQRKEDIPLLFEHFLWAIANRYGSEVPGISKRQLQLLLQHDWPGNVRELRNFAECLLLLGSERAFTSLNPDNNDHSEIVMSLAEQVSSFEKMLLKESLQRHGGRLKDCQQELGIGRKTLYEKMKKFQLDKQVFKEMGAE